MDNSKTQLSDWSTRGIVLFFAILLLWQIVFGFVLFSQPIFYKYPMNARAFLDNPEPSARWMDFSPLYFFVNVAFCLIGLPVDTCLIILQICLANLGLFLFFCIVGSLLSQRTAAISVLLVGLYPAFHFYTNCLEPEIFIFVFNMAGLYWAIVRNNSLMSGCSFSLTLLTRPSIFPFLLLAGFFQPKRKIFYYIPVMISIGLMLLFSNWAIQKPTLSFMSPGSVFYEGNNPHTPGIAPFYPTALKLVEIAPAQTEPDYAHVLYRQIASLETGTSLTMVEQQLFWIRKAVAFVSDYPLLSARRYLKKAWYTLLNKEIYDTLPLLPLEDRLKTYALFSFGIFTAFGLIGLLSQFKRVPGLIYLGIIWSFLTIIIFYFTSRQRLGLFAFFLFLTACGIETIRKKRGLLVPVCLIFLLTCIQPSEIKQYNDVFREFSLANHLIEKATTSARNLDENATIFFVSANVRMAPHLRHFLLYPHQITTFDNYYLRALSIDNVPQPEFEKGLLLFQLEQYDQAHVIFEKIKKKKIYKSIFSITPPIYYYLICLYHMEKAIPSNELAWAMQNFPGNIAVMALAETQGVQVDMLRYHDLLSVTYFRAMTNFHLDAYERALEYFMKFEEMAPGLAIIHEYQALCAGYSGDIALMCDRLATYTTSQLKRPLPIQPRWFGLARYIDQIPESEIKIKAQSLIATLLPSH
ncbi:hypothetical protein JXQ70_00115 [bacterium]|nr:hypothetical protein [bacterium]